MSVTHGRVFDRDLEAAFEELTPTQMKVLEGVNSGRLNKQIAFDLGIAEATVKAHMTALMRKLNVQNRTQAAIAAQALAHGPRSVAR
jgi:DNA-binding NarL/FixJ family response regulator